MVTLKDVAHEAQVSISTVSAVLGGRAEKLGIKEETRRKVLLTARKLRYRRNGIAAQMKSGRATTLVLLLSDTTQEFVFQVAAAACAEAERHGCFVKLLVTESGEGFRRQLDSVIGQCPAGLLHWANAYENTPLLEQAARECRLPLIYLDSCDSSAAGCVRTDEVDGIRQGIRHLVELGHRRIAHVTDTLPANYARERLDGFRKVMAEFRLPVVEENIFHERQENQKELAAFLQRILNAPEPVTAISCGSDFFAVSVLTQLMRMGVRIPEEVSLIGYADLSFCRLTTPALTTIHQPFDRIGSEAVKLALSSKYDHPRQLLLPAELIQRDSTGPAPHA